MVSVLEMLIFLITELQNGLGNSDEVHSVMTGVPSIGHEVTEGARIQSLPVDLSLTT
jgi:hypothetical protein